MARCWRVARVRWIMTEVGGHRHKGAQHRYPGVIQGIINRHDDLDPGKGYQPQGVEGQGRGRLLGIHRGELAVLINEPNYGLGQEDQTAGRGQGDQDGQGQGRLQGFPEGGQIAVGGVAGDHRQGGHHQGHAEQAHGQMEQPVGVIEPGDAALGATGGIEGVDEDIDLGGGQAHHRREHQLDDPQQSRFPEIKDPLSLNPTRHNSGNWTASCREPPTRVPQAMPTMGATPNRGAGQAQTHAGDDGAQVEKTGGQGGDKKLALGVEDSHGQGRQGHQDQEGKHDPGHQGGEFQLSRDRAEIRGHDPDDIRGEPHAQP